MKISIYHTDLPSSKSVADAIPRRVALLNRQLLKTRYIWVDCTTKVHVNNYTEKTKLDDQIFEKKTWVRDTVISAFFIFCSCQFASVFFWSKL